MRQQLFSADTIQTYRDAIHQGVDVLTDHVSGVRRPFSGRTVAEVAPAVDAVDLDRPLGDLDEALAELRGVYLDDAVWFHEPRYLAHLNCPVVIPALVAEQILSAVNSSLDTWDQSAGGTLVERRLIDWTAERIGFAGGADGVFTSGGTQSNLQALLMARAHAYLAGDADPTAPLADTLARLREGLDAATLYEGQLDDPTRARFDRVLTDLGLDPSHYWVMPVHPWQWRHKLAVTFAPDVARRDLVHLGSAGDRWRAQQSIRTFLDTDRPDRHYVKTALSVQNMGFMRGLSPKYMRATPAINDWVHDLVVADPDLQASRFGVLRERAAIGYTGDAYHRLADPSAYQKMVAALWRESPVPRLEAGERLATMASLLHRDREGRHLATAMVRASGLDPATWVRQYLDAYLRPVAHCLIAHDLAFMPHGENVILVLRDHVPTRVFMKDIGEEVAVLGDGPLPPDVERIRARVPEGQAALSVLTDVFDGFLRFLAAILAEDQLLATDDFWAEVAGCLLDHRRDHPELAEAFERTDLFAAEFAHSCLNRLQLRNTRSMVDLADQASSLQFAGTLLNPVARFASPRRSS